MDLEATFSRGCHHDAVVRLEGDDLERRRAVYMRGQKHARDVGEASEPLDSSPPLLYFVPEPTASELVGEMDGRVTAHAASVSAVRQKTPEPDNLGDLSFDMDEFIELADPEFDPTCLVDDGCWADSVGSASASAGGGSRPVTDSAQAAVGADLSAPDAGCASAAAGDRDVEPTTLIYSSATAAADSGSMAEDNFVRSTNFYDSGIGSFTHTRDAGTSTEDTGDESERFGRKCDSERPHRQVSTFQLAEAASSIVAALPTISAQGIFHHMSMWMDLESQEERERAWVAAISAGMAERLLAQRLLESAATAVSVDSSGGVGLASMMVELMTRRGRQLETDVDFGSEPPAGRIAIQEPPITIDDD